MVNLTPEQKAREKIDQMLEASGWVIQNMDTLDFSNHMGVAVREYQTEAGYADYILFLNRKPVGVIEAKREEEGHHLTVVEEQSGDYAKSRLKHFENDPLRFVYESTGVLTRYTDFNDPKPRSRPVFSFHRPETLKEWMKQGETLQARFSRIPALETEGLRECQYGAIADLETSFGYNRPRALIQMATGAGKTYTAITFVYRLLKYADAKRILFLVDTRNLGEQAEQEFMKYIPQDDNRKFSELYVLQRLQSSYVPPNSQVCISTIQRLYSILKGEELEEEAEEVNPNESAWQPKEPLPVVYNPKVPIEFFDFIVIDECHRSIYNLWKQVLEYFDAYLIGLTATPDKRTFGFFNENVVSEYSHEEAVADGVNVGYEVYTIETEITQEGAKLKAKEYVDVRDRLTRKKRWTQLDEDYEYNAKQLDKDVVNPSTIRNIIRTFRDKLKDIFPDREEVPKTLIFAKTDSHADDIIQIVREEFNEGNEFCKKVTYKADEDPKSVLAQFRNEYNPRIAVTVDMIATGTDVKPLECLLFMRDVKSKNYFEQMKGRGTRTINPADLRAVTPENVVKTHFIIVDAVGVCENDKTDSRPLERKPGVKFESLLMSVAQGNRDEDMLTSLAGRLARLEQRLGDKEIKEIEETTGMPLKDIVNSIIDAVDPDKKMEKAKEMFATDHPTEEQVKKAAKELADKACLIFDDPKVRNTLVEVRQRSYQTIDTVSKDHVIFAGFDEQAKEKAQQYIDTFKQFIEDNKDELTALQIIYGRPYGQRHITYEQIRQLADAIRKPPYKLAPEVLWQAYERLDKSKVRGSGPQKLLTNIISLVRFAVGQADVLEPFSESVEHRFHEWLREQEREGVTFTDEQRAWLVMIKNHIATSASIGISDFELTPFAEKGGAIKFYRLFGDNTEKILEELNEVLVK